MIPPWTLAVQLGTAVLIAVFFAVLASSSRRPAIALWLGAWVCEAVAASAALTILIGSGDPTADLGWGLRPLIFVFAAAKTLFALFLVRGLRRMLRPNEPLRGIAQIVYFALFWGVLWALLAPRAVDMLPAQWLLVAVVAIAGAVGVLRQNPDRGSRLLPRAVLGAGVVYLIYVPLSVPSLLGEVANPALWRGSSLLDAAVDLVLAAAMLVTVERARADRMEDLFERLQNSNESLRRLADIDPLTGLANRRKLRETLEEVDDAAIVSLDLDGFKEINEVYGHEVGDACLTWMARTLRRAFRPTDHVFRLGGDEFLVVAPNCSLEKAADRVRAVGVILGEGTTVRPPLEMSHGMALLVADQQADVALREANRQLHESREGKRTAKG